MGAVGEADAHEFWIEPERYQIDEAGASAGPIVADLRNGEMFAGIQYYYNPQRFLSFEQWVGGPDGAVDGAFVDGRLGDRPAFQAAELPDGLAILAYQSRYATVDYADWARFESFAVSKGLEDVAERHAARGLEEGPLVEAYMRFAKSLIAVGPTAADGADAPLGFEAELVALTNPYAGPTADVAVLALYQQEPRPDVQVELFERAPDGSVTMSVHRTDADGVVRLPVRPGRSYLVNSVILRAPAPAVADHTGGVWETLWTSLTFATPDGSETAAAAD